MSSSTELESRSFDRARTRHRAWKSTAAAALVLALAGPGWSQSCPASALSKPKGNTLYLYFPTSSDSTFPEYDPDATTSPLGAFDVADLDSGIGTTAQLRDAIFDLVTIDYCEFNVEVVLTTSKPSPSEARWQIVGIGSDAETVFGSDLFGVAQAVDTGDADAQDYARVYADSFGSAYGGAGGELAGSNSTLQRWARAIGHTTSHEAGHNYGLSHSHSSSETGEDERANHIMATGSTLSGTDRVTRVRHFSDTSYEILGHNVGLNIKTLHNWDFVNPNATTAHSLVLTILSEASSLTIDWSYNGPLSPWTNPTIASTGATKSFQGDTYNEYELTFSTPKSWSGGADGEADPGVKFHVGATFSESDAILVYEATLSDSGGSELGLHPRMMGYDAGATDAASGDFAMSFFNPNPADGPLEIRDLEIRFLPRLVDIEAMVDGAELVDLRGLPVQARPPTNKELTRIPSIELEGSQSLTLANLTDPRHVDIVYDPTGCERGFVPGPRDARVGEIEYCPEGNALSLFPATMVYVTATVVDPSADHFDPASGAIVTGPLESKLFYQFAGIVPDLNGNGVDDLIDLREGTSVDQNANGVPDEAERERDGGLPWWILLLVLVLVVFLVLVLRR